MKRQPTTQQPQLALDDPFLNRGLFADHFLHVRLQGLREWQEPAGLQEAYAEALKIRQSAARTLGRNPKEARTERHFIRPLLDLLWGEKQPGDCYEVQEGITNLETPRQPDYVMFSQAADRDHAAKHADTLDFWRDVPCLADAKRWTASLDKRRGEENPSDQIVNYLYRSRVRWGMLTNGRIWRLYEQDKSRTGGTYFEVDLEAILKRQDIQSFRWFYLFFRREAHLPDKAGKTFLDKVFDGSFEYATEVGDKLKESVYDALSQLMNGFCEWPGNQLDARDDATRKLVHDNCLILLYRLLFILYAEDRGMLPCEDKSYEPLSLRMLHRHVNDALREELHFPPGGLSFWPPVCNLFRHIDRGFQDEGRWIIPPYNGGLFSPKEHPQIRYDAQGEPRRWEIGDNRLAQAVDMLAYRRERWDKPGSQDIDYASLAVQHLGSIYEGLLELQPRVAETDRVEVSEGGKPVYKPVAEVPNPRNIKGQPPRRVKPGEIYLVSSRGERKATGSYYTPSYIVDYIVEHTIGPLAEEAAAKTKQMAAELGDLEARLEKTESPTAMRHLTDQRDDLRARITEPYLSLRILDPAMGSGHFLVGAADFLSFRVANDESLTALVDTGDEDPQVYYKRLIVERCLCGVDLNPLAVELAKLSLWLHTVSKDKALSFLDHHLRCGNSLIGAWVKDMGRPPKAQRRQDLQAKRDEARGALSLLDDPDFTQHMARLVFGYTEIAHIAAKTREDVQHQSRILQDIEKDHQRRFAEIGDLWCSACFGLEYDADGYSDMSSALQRGEVPFSTDSRSGIATSRHLAAERHFLHWELTFPEVFFDEYGRRKEEAGFDAVIGNPPYVRPHRLPDEVKRSLWARYRGYAAKSDVLNCFLESGLDLLRSQGRLGMITSDTWRVLDSSRALRELLLQEACVNTLWLLPVGVFEDAQVKPVVVLLSKEGSQSVRAANPVSVYVGETRSRHWKCSQATWARTPGCLFDVGRGARLGIHDRFSLVASPLGALCVVDFGLKTGDDARFLNRTGIRREDRRLIASRDVSRYWHCWHGDYVWYRPDLMREHRPTARPGEAERFERPKVILSRMAQGLVASMDATDLYVKDALLLALPAGPSLLYITALLNSRGLNHWYLSTFTTVDTHRNEVMQVPVRLIDFGNRAPRVGMPNLLAVPSSALSASDYALPLSLATQALATHALLHGPAGKPELREDPYWAAQIATADPDFPGREDFVHDLLAMLAQRMMDMNREKHEARGQFLTWLEHTAGCQVEGLSNKTKLQAFWEHDTLKLIEVLRANRKKLAADLTTSAFVNAFVREHGEAVARLTPILETLRRTDDLIDEIVYKLYGLTEEEIAIVKGAASPEAAD